MLIQIHNPTNTLMEMDNPMGEIKYIAVSMIVPPKRRIRIRFQDKESEKKLLESMWCVENPICVRQKVRGYYRLIDGEIRLRLAIKAGLLKIPCLIVEF